MSIGRISTPIELIIVEKVKDDEGFSEDIFNFLAQVRAYREDKNASKRWANRALFSEATTLFRIRRIPNIKITNKMMILCDGAYYEIVSVENIKNRSMYYEILAKKVVTSDG